MSSNHIFGQDDLRNFRVYLFIVWKRRALQRQLTCLQLASGKVKQPRHTHKHGLNWLLDLTYPSVTTMLLTIYKPPSTQSVRAHHRDDCRFGQNTQRSHHMS